MTANISSYTVCTYVRIVCTVLNIKVICTHVRMYTSSHTCVYYLSMYVLTGLTFWLYCKVAYSYWQDQRKALQDEVGPNQLFCLYRADDLMLISAGPKGYRQPTATDPQAW